VPVLFILMEFANAGTLETLLRVPEEAEVGGRFSLDPLELGQLTVRPVLPPRLPGAAVRTGDAPAAATAVGFGARRPRPPALPARGAVHPAEHLLLRGSR